MVSESQGISKDEIKQDVKACKVLATFRYLRAIPGHDN